MNKFKVIFVQISGLKIGLDWPIESETGGVTGLV
jgi:hypothetical protein